MLHDPTDVREIRSHKLANAQQSIDPAGVLTLALQLTNTSLIDIRKQFRESMLGALSHLQSKCFFDFDAKGDSSSLPASMTTRPNMPPSRSRIGITSASSSTMPAKKVAMQAPLTSLSRINEFHFLENFTSFFDTLKFDANSKRAKLQHQLEVLVEAQKHKSQNRQQQHQTLLRIVDQPHSHHHHQQNVNSLQNISPEVSYEMSLPDDRINQRIHETTDQLETVTECCEVLAYCSDTKFLDRFYHLIDCGSRGFVKWDDITNFFLDGAVLAKVYSERADALSEWQVEPAAIRGISHRPHKLRAMGDTENLIILDRSDALFTFDPVFDKSTTIAASGSIVSTSITCVEFIPTLDCFLFATTAAELVIYDPNFTGAINHEKVHLPFPVMVMSWCQRMQRLLCGDRQGRVAAYKLARSRWKRLLPPVFDCVLTSHGRSAELLSRNAKGPTAAEKVLSQNEKREKERTGFVQPKLYNPTVSTTAAAAATAEEQRILQQKRDYSPPSSRSGKKPNSSPTRAVTLLHSNEESEPVKKLSPIASEDLQISKSKNDLATSKMMSKSTLQSSINTEKRGGNGDEAETTEVAVVAIAIHRLNGSVVVAYEDGLCQVITPPYSTHDHKSFISSGKPLCCIAIVETQGSVIMGTSEPVPEVWSLAACEDRNVKPHYLTARNSRHESPIVGITTFKDSDQCFSLDFLGLVKVWDLRTNAPLQHFQLEVRDARIGWVCMQGSGAGDAIYCCDRQQIICFRRSDDIKASSNALLAKKSKQGEITTTDASAADDPEQQYLMHQHKNALRQMDVEASDIGANITFGGYSPLTLRVVSSTARQVVYHETATGKPVCEADVLQATSHLASATQATEDTGSGLATGQKDGEFSPSRIALRQATESSKREITAAILDSAGARMYCGLSNGSVITLNVASGGVVEVFPLAHRSKVECFAFIDHLNCAVSCGADGSGSYLYRPPTGELEGTTKTATGTSSAAASNDSEANALHLPVFPAFRCMNGCVVAYVGDPTFVLLATDAEGRISAFDCQRFDPTGANSVTPLFTMRIAIGTNASFETKGAIYDTPQNRVLESRPHTSSNEERLGSGKATRPTSSATSIVSDFDKGDNLAGFIESAMDPSAVASSLLSVQKTAAALHAMRRKKKGIVTPQSSPRDGTERDDPLASLSPVEKLRALINSSGSRRPGSSTASGAARMVQTIVNILVFKNQEHIIIGDPQYMTLVRLDRVARNGVILGQWAMDTNVSPSMLRNPDLALRMAVNQTTTDPLVTALHLDTDRNVLLAVYDGRTVVAMDVGSFVPYVDSAADASARRAKADARIKIREERKMLLQQQALANARRRSNAYRNSQSTSSYQESGSEVADVKLCQSKLPPLLAESRVRKQSLIDPHELSVSSRSAEISKNEESNEKDAEGETKDEYDDVGDVLDAPDPQPRWLYQVKTNSPVVSIQSFSVKPPVSDALPLVSSQRPSELITKLLFSQTKATQLDTPSRHFALIGYIDGYVDLLDASADLNLTWTSSKVWAQPIQTEYPHPQEDTLLVHTFVPYRESELEHEVFPLRKASAPPLRRHSSMLAGIRRQSAGPFMTDKKSPKLLPEQQEPRLTVADLSRQLHREADRLENFNRRQSFSGVNNGVVYAKSLTQALRRKSVALSLRKSSLSYSAAKTKYSSQSSIERKEDRNSTSELDFSADKMVTDTPILGAAAPPLARVNSLNQSGGAVAAVVCADKPPKSTSLLPKVASSNALHSESVASMDRSLHQRPPSAAQGGVPPMQLPISALKRHSHAQASPKSVAINDNSLSINGIPAVSMSSSQNPIFAAPNLSTMQVTENAVVPILNNSFGPFVSEADRNEKQDTITDADTTIVNLSSTRLRQLQSFRNVGLIKRSETLPFSVPSQPQEATRSPSPTSGPRRGTENNRGQSPNRPVVIVTGALTTVDSPLPTASASRCVTPDPGLHAKDWLSVQLSVLGRGRVKIKKARKVKKASIGSIKGTDRSRSREGTIVVNVQDDVDSTDPLQKDKTIDSINETGNDAALLSVPTTSGTTVLQHSANPMASKPNTPYRQFGYDVTRSRRKRERVKSLVNLEDEAQLKAIQVELQAADERAERRKRRQSSVYGKDDHRAVDDATSRDEHNVLTAKVQGSFDFFAERLRREMHGEIMGEDESSSSDEGGCASYSSEYESLDTDQGEYYDLSGRPTLGGEKFGAESAKQMDLALQILKDKKAGLIPLFTTRGGIPVYLNEDCSSVCIPADNLHILGSTSNMQSDHVLQQQQLNYLNDASHPKNIKTGVRKGTRDVGDGDVEPSVATDLSMRLKAEGPGGYREYAVIASFRNQDPRSTTKEDKVQKTLSMLRRHRYELEDFAARLNMGSRFVKRKRPMPEEVLNVSSAMGRRVLISEMHQHTGGTDKEQKDAEEADRLAKEVSGNAMKQPNRLLGLDKKAWWARAPTTALPEASRPGTESSSNRNSRTTNEMPATEDPSIEGFNVPQNKRPPAVVDNTTRHTKKATQRTAPPLPYQLLAQNKALPKVPLQTRPATREGGPLLLTEKTNTSNATSVALNRGTSRGGVMLAPLPKPRSMSQNGQRKGEKSNAGSSTHLLDGALEVKHIPSELMDISNYHRDYLGPERAGTMGRQQRTNTPHNVQRFKQQD